MARYVVIDANGLAVNCIEWDGKSKFDPGPGLSLVQYEGNWGEGWQHDGPNATFVKTQAVLDKEADEIQRMAAARMLGKQSIQEQFDATLAQIKSGALVVDPVTFDVSPAAVAAQPAQGVST